jgi:hypothetical protein
MNGKLIFREFAGFSVRCRYKRTDFVVRPSQILPQLDGATSFQTPGEVAKRFGYDHSRFL